MSTTETRHQPPFGLPVLAELPELGHALEQLASVDRAIASAIDQLVHLHVDGTVESATGVDLEHWLATIARRTRSDRRMLACVVEMCARLPHLHAAFSYGELSWAQLRSVVLQVHRLPRHLDEQLDTALAGAVADTAGHDPDALSSLVRWIVDDLRATPPEASTGPTTDVLVLQPRLDGSGGRVFGDLSAVGFAAVDAATEPGPPPQDADGATDHRSSAQRRATRLTELCLTAPLASAQGSTGAQARGRTGAQVADDHTTEDRGEADRGPGAANVQVLLRAELTTLLGMGRDSAALLTHTTGGAMWTDADTARDLADRATRVRLIVTRDGAPVGVGRLRRTAPGWLRDAALALHDTCSHPGCLTAARVSDDDHAHAWADGGSTDVGNLAPLCATHNHRKEAGGWTAAQTTTGHRTWVHRRSGLATRTAPATWRPAPPAPPPAPSTGAETSGPWSVTRRRPPLHGPSPTTDADADRPSYQVAPTTTGTGLGLPP